jgi:hypothetical protein
MHSKNRCGIVEIHERFKADRRQCWLWDGGQSAGWNELRANRGDRLSHIRHVASPSLDSLMANCAGARRKAEFHASEQHESRLTDDSENVQFRFESLLFHLSISACRHPGEASVG